MIDRAATPARSGETSPSSPVWVQAHVTDAALASSFLHTLASPHTLCLPSADGDRGYHLGLFSHRARGHGALPPAGVLRATPIARELLDYHRALGVGALDEHAPARLRRRELAAIALTDAPLLRQLESRGYRQGFAPFNSLSVARLFERLDLETTWCGAAPHVYEQANDKLAFASAGESHGFPTLPGHALASEDQIEPAWRKAVGEIGPQCVLRLRRAAGGRGLVVAGDPDSARSAWRRLARAGDVALFPWIPSSKIVRQISSHGLVDDGRFAPLCITEQLLDGSRYRGAVQREEWDPQLVGEMQRAHDGAARWLRDIGFRRGAAGFDGLLVEQSGRARYVLVDPNIRATGTTLPWATVARLSEAAGRAFVWQVASFRILGPRPRLASLRRTLAEDLLDPARLSAGGILPSVTLTGLRAGPVAGWWLRAILLAESPLHLAHLESRIPDLGLLV